jgi:ribosomal protein S18 acetylase RimI-like enzyme
VNEIDLRLGSLDQPDVQALIDSWNEQLAGEIAGFTSSSGSLVREEEFRDTQGGCFLTAYVEGDAIGCGGIRQLDAETAELKRLYVSPTARSRGIGSRLLAELEDAARRLGYGRIRLDTQRDNAAALGLFRSSGYREIGDYNRNPLADAWLEKVL